ncbi:hypothetical protein EGW08_001092, partial [Elysia chlorotica]
MVFSANTVNSIPSTTVETTQIVPVFVSSTYEQHTGEPPPVSTHQSISSIRHATQVSASAPYINKFPITSALVRQPSSSDASTSHSFTTQDAQVSGRYHRSTMPHRNEPFVPYTKPDQFNAPVSQSALTTPHANQLREVPETQNQGRLPSRLEETSSPSSSHSLDSNPIFSHLDSLNTPSPGNSARRTLPFNQSLTSTEHTSQTSTHNSQSIGSFTHSESPDSLLFEHSEDYALARAQNVPPTSDNEDYRTYVAQTRNSENYAQARAQNVPLTSERQGHRATPARISSIGSTTQTFPTSLNHSRPTPDAATYSTNRTPTVTVSATETFPSTSAASGAGHPPVTMHQPSFEELRIIAERPKNPGMAIYSARLQTFDAWLRDSGPAKEQLAKAGFFYTGKADATRCFCCGGGLKNWDPDDDADVEHVRILPKCPFMRQRVGQAFIDTVRLLATEHSKISLQMVMDAMTEDKPRFAQ